MQNKAHYIFWRQEIAGLGTNTPTIVERWLVSHAVSGKVLAGGFATAEDAIIWSDGAQSKNNFTK